MGEQRSAVVTEEGVVGSRLARLERDLEELTRSVRQLEQLVAGLDRTRRGAQPGAGAGPAVAAALASGATDTVARERVDAIAVVSFVGRTLVVLGGAYFLRALTETGVLAAAVGVGLGLAYAAVWLGLAHRSALRGAGLAAVFHGVAYCLIAFPLVAEAATRFSLLGPVAAATVLTLASAAALAVAWRTRLQGLAWVATLFSLGTAMVLFVREPVAAPVVVSVIVLGLATLWLGYDREWTHLRWPVAVMADLMALGLMLRATASRPVESPRATMLVQLFLLTAYVSMIAARTLVRGRSVLPFEVFQIVAALVAGLGGAAYVAGRTGSGVVALGVITVAFGAACYGVAFAFVERRAGAGVNFYFYTTLALALVLVGSSLAAWGPVVAMAWAVLALATTVLGRQFARGCLIVHGATYVTAAAVGSGLLATAALALFGSASVPWGPPLTAAGLSVLAAAAAVALMAPVPVDSSGVAPRVPRALNLSVLAWCAGGTLIAVAAPLLVDRANGTPDAGTLATLRTAVIAASALALAWLGRSPRLREASWLVYPVLVIGGLKFVLEDVTQSRASTLFVALVLYGLALVVAPRIVRASSQTVLP